MKDAIGRALNDAILHLSPISGGSICRTYQVKTQSGSDYFVKYHSDCRILISEALGLATLENSQTVTVPSPVRQIDHFLILPLIESARPSLQFWQTLGFELAQLHRCTHTTYGFTDNNFIGSTPQSNQQSTSWPDFFWQERILRQYELYTRGHNFDPSLDLLFRQFAKRFSEVLSEPEAPALLHGDLWSGNFICRTDQAPILIDPAVYYGDRETDIAMTQLFGGFNQAFYQAYNEAYPLRPGHKERTEVYNLYHLLNHLNLFGSSYLPQVTQVLKKFA